MADEEESLIDLFHKHLGEDVPLKLPPNVFEELQLSYKTYEPDKSLVCAFPALEQFANPMGMYQGGILGAAFDMVFGSLAALLVKRACTTVTLEQQFIRPIAADGSLFTIEARMRAIKSSFIFLEGTAKDRNGKLFATATTTMAPYRMPRVDVED